MKKLIIGFFCIFTIMTLKPWTWPVVIENKTQNPRVRLSVVDEYIYSLPHQNRIFVREQEIGLTQIVLPPQNLTPPPIGRRVMVWTKQDVTRSNKILIAQPYLIKPEDVEKHFIFAREPSGHYQVHWDNDHNLIATQEQGYKQALKLF